MPVSRRDFIAPARRCSSRFEKRGKEREDQLKSSYLQDFSSIPRLGKTVHTALGDGVDGGLDQALSPLLRGLGVRLVALRSWAITVERVGRIHPAQLHLCIFDPDLAVHG